MHRQRTLIHEKLETRCTPATFGIPWQDPSHLTLSFAPDGTQIAGHASELFSALGSQQPEPVWQREVLTAFQAWAEHANLNFGLQHDEGQAFGAAGMPQGDPRFGDIRLGAQAMSEEALAIALPPDPALSGTLAGDVFINSQYAFNGQPYALLPVLLHEAGHALGLGDSLSTDAVMYSRYSASRTTLTSEDISRIQALYGRRAPDRYEGALGNDIRTRAAAFQLPANYKGETPLVAFGDISNRKDVDFFGFRSPADGNDDVFDRSVTIRVQTAGSSLLAPKVTVLDMYGRVLARQTSTSITGDTLQVTVPELSSRQRYFVRVEAAQQNVFGVGRYGLSVRFDKTSSTADQVIERLLSGPFEQLGPDAIDAFFRASGDTLLNAEEQLNDMVETATPLAASLGYAVGTRFEAVASLGKREDLDFYQLTAPAGDSRTLLASVWTTDNNGFEPKLTVVDQLGHAVSSKVLVQGNGTSTVEVQDTVAGRKYFLRVEVARQAQQDKGNYFVSAHFGTQAATLTTFATGALHQHARARSYRLYIAEPQLMHFVLATGGEDLGASIALSLFNANGLVATFAAVAGETRSSGSVLLTPGSYTVILEIENPNGSAVTFQLYGSAQSDPIGPVLLDPTLDPVFDTLPTSPEEPTVFVYPDLPLPYDPSVLVGYINPHDPSTWPPDFVLLPEHLLDPWFILSLDPFYFVPLQ